MYLSDLKYYLATVNPSYLVDTEERWTKLLQN